MPGLELGTEVTELYTLSPFSPQGIPGLLRKQIDTPTKWSEILSKGGLQMYALILVDGQFRLTVEGGVTDGRAE